MADEKRDQMGSEGGGSYGANEREQTNDRERVAEGREAEDSDDFVTDAEMEVREANSSERKGGKGSR
jgi:hypothetical protein